MASGAHATAAFDSSSDLAAFLERMGATRPDDERFPARNFRLDEGVIEQRCDRYHSLVEKPSWSTWQRLHNRYLDRDVAWRSGALPPKHVDPGSSATPATFAGDAQLADFGDTAGSVMLVRVATASGIARRARVSVARVEDALTRPGALEPLLAIASRARDELPEFAGFWDDLRPELPEDERLAPVGWANTVRNRLGLSYLVARSGRPVQILVFRFEAARVPRCSTARGRRAVAVPTVLDTRMFPAFCPAPLGPEIGRIVDLTAELAQPAREMLLPPLRLHERDLFRIGHVTDDGTLPPLSEARQAHLYVIRDELDRPDYGDRTDGDLL